MTRELISLSFDQVDLPAQEPEPRIGRRTVEDPSSAPSLLLGHYQRRFHERFGYEAVAQGGAMTPEDDRKELGKARSIMDGFARHYGLDIGTKIIDAIFDFYGGEWRGEVFGITRFSENSRWITDQVRHQVMRQQAFEFTGSDDSDMLRAALEARSEGSG